ncbi:TIR domain-containing protein [Exiguobacterium antarcticum]|uniref:TIR domain-containing protein n=1 Tax=Exiguobacterium antarcticum TaxID=132920 RepID=A0ABT6QXW4_9BACL|nr:toll/interleukin-1 receptor domain-containing protein [Exiguobacterium antarcticum]MDI3233529.1 TIR domain-containing protein [Exiguobacterium antarcticum]
MKAFLSHNSADKDFVEKVAKKLKREETIFDKSTFEEGEDFRDSILKHLNDTTLFVLFASKESLKAPWVKYELDNAELLLIKGEIKKILIFLIGNDVSHSDLPEWCQKILVERVTNANITARLIKEKLITVNDNYSEVFVGRGAENDKFSEHLFKTNAKFQVLVFYGLNGVGRRTFAKNILQNLYNLKLGPIFEVDSTENLVNLYIKIKDDIEEITTQNNFEKYVNSFKDLEVEDQVEEIIRLLKNYSTYKISPCILDQGGLLNHNGHYKKEFELLMKKVNSTPELFLTILQTRNPNYFDRDQFFFVTYLNPLTDAGMNSLLSTYLRNLQVQYTRESIIEFTGYLDGYPPAAQFVRSTIQSYGIDIALADKSLLMDFKAKTFTTYLKNMVGDNETKIMILKMCEAFPPLSIDVLKTLVQKNEKQEDIIKSIQELIDQSIITVDHQNNRYTLSAPLKESVRRIWKSLNKKDYKDAAMILKKIYWKKDEIPSISILETLIFCLLRAEEISDLKEFSSVILPSTILKVAKSSYRDKEWQKTIELSKKALELNYELDEARVLIFKSQVRENEKSDEILNELRKRNYTDYYALKGFRDLKRKKYTQAIESYKKAITKGIKSVVVYREIAECYYWLKDFNSAMKYIDIITKRQKRPNSFVYDLAAKIAIENKDFEKAQEYISILETVDRVENVYHRKASLLSKQGNFNEAIEYAEKACLRQPPLPEMFLNKVYILTKLNNYEEASSVLDYISKHFKSQQNQKFYNELKCRVSLELDGWEEAEVYYKKINGDSEYTKELNYKILKKKLEDDAFDFIEKQSIRKEIEVLDKEGISEDFEQEYSKR